MAAERGPGAFFSTPLLLPVLLPVLCSSILFYPIRAYPYVCLRMYMRGVCVSIWSWLALQGDWSLRDGVGKLAIVHWWPGPRDIQAAFHLSEGVSVLGCYLLKLLRSIRACTDVKCQPPGTRPDAPARHAAHADVPRRVDISCDTNHASMTWCTCIRGRPVHISIFQLFGAFTVHGTPEPWYTQDADF